MSLITRCPACETLFKVVPDQLRISDGWVRCGRCGDVFDASLQLLPDSATETVFAVQNESSIPGFEATVSVKAESDSKPVNPDPEHLNSSVGLSSEGDKYSAAAPPDTSIPVDEIPSQTDYSQSLPIDAAGSDPSQSTLEQLGSVAPAEAESISDCEDASFLNQKNSNSLGSRIVVRAILGLVSSLLVLALCGQVVFHERDRIATLYPKSRPWLQALCRPLHCSLSPFRQIEFITIDSSSFVKIGPFAYRLNLALKNAGESKLAMPSIEMTLTDSFDQPVVRRVFLPIDLDAKLDTLDVGTEWPVSLSLLVKPPSAASQITGYRLLAFYP